MTKNHLIKGSSEDVILHSGESFDFLADISEYSADKRYSLYFTGETKLFYAWRDEIDFQHLYGLIDDSLNNTEAERSRYCLDFSMNGEEKYVKRAVKKIVWAPSLFDVADLFGDESDVWDCGIYAKAKGLRIGKDGFLRLRFEVRYAVDGKDKAFTDIPPDVTEDIDIAEGDYGYRLFSKKINIPKDRTASVMVYLEGSGYSGEVYFERPQTVSSSGYNILPDFSTSVQNRPFFDWYGCNLSRRERPHFTVSVGGRTVFDGEYFEAMHRYPSFEFDIPSDVLKMGQNSISVRYHATYREPAPFGIGEVRLLEREGGELAVIGYGENAILGGEFCILVRTDRDRVEAKLECNSNEVECLSELYFEKAGLHTVKVSPRVMKNGLDFSLVCENKRNEIVIKHVCRKENDGVITGTGDAVYINFDEAEPFEKFFEWYVENNIGELLTLRPIYRWGGTRTLSDKSWRRTAELLDSMGYRYSMMSDGRDIPGYDKHPTPEMISGSGFLGYQLHERDGQFFYWNFKGGRPVQNFQILDEFYDICMRMYRESPVSMTPVYKPCNVKMTDKKYSLRMDVDNGYDSDKLSDGITKQLSDIRDHYTRHTGPAVNFRSFFKAGYNWLGAETMYTSDEIQLAFLRGASRAYGADSFGVHAAVQWSNRPHDCEIRQRLYRLALYVPYICGATEINTEEGLYRMEAGYAAYDKFSSVCRAHLEQQRDFNRYVTSHTRRGEFYSPIAFIYGRDDTWTGYYTSSNVICGRMDLLSGDIAKSWWLLNEFYPSSCIGSSRPYANRANEKTYMYSETPFGNVDVAPIESKKLDRYRLLSFAGFNRAVCEDMDKLVRYMKRGGKIIMGWPHLSDTKDCRDAVESKMSFSGNAIVRLVGGVPTFSKDTLGGKAVHLASTLTGYDKVIKNSDNGTPIAVSKNVGEGELVFVNTLEYPGNEAVQELYKSLLENLAKELTNEEFAWIERSDGIEFSVYDSEDGTRYFYVIAVDFENDPAELRRAILRIGEDKYAIELTFGVMLKIAVKDGIAVWSVDESGELSDISDGKVRVEGTGRIEFVIAKNGCTCVRSIDFSECSEQTIELT